MLINHTYAIIHILFLYKDKMIRFCCACACTFLQNFQTIYRAIPNKLHRFIFQMGHVEPQTNATLAVRLNYSITIPLKEPQNPTRKPNSFRVVTFFDLRDDSGEPLRLRNNRLHYSGVENITFERCRKLN